MSASGPGRIKTRDRGVISNDIYKRLYNWCYTSFVNKRRGFPLSTCLEEAIAVLKRRSFGARMRDTNLPGQHDNGPRHELLTKRSNN